VRAAEGPVPALPGDADNGRGHAAGAQCRKPEVASWVVPEEALKVLVPTLSDHSFEAYGNALGQELERSTHVNFHRDDPRADAVSVRGRAVGAVSRDRQVQ